MSTTTLPAYQNLRLERREQVTVLFVNRPQVMNAINRETLAEIGDAVRAFTADASQGALVVTGQGEKAFISGADINELAPLAPGAAEDISRFGQSVVDLLEQSSKPVIAAVNGYAFGGGCELALACHMRLASDNAVMGLPETKLGIIPGYGGTQRLPRLVGPGRALELILSGRNVKADEAERIGLVNRVAGAGALRAAALELAQAIAANGPVAVRAAKDAIDGGVELPLSAGLEHEARCYERVLGTQDRLEALAAFAEKRKPRYAGK